MEWNLVALSHKIPILPSIFTPSYRDEQVVIASPEPVWPPPLPSQALPQLLWSLSLSPQVMSSFATELGCSKLFLPAIAMENAVLVVVLV